MSTCPNSDLYSAFVDGEIPSPWKEKLENHISHCEKCSKKVQQYRALREAMKIETSIPSQDFLNQSLIKVERKIAFLTQQKSELELRKKTAVFWKNSHIRMPVPILAALLLAAIFIPAFITQKVAEKLYSSRDIANSTHSVINVLGYGTNSQEIINTSNSVYSPDLPDKTIASFISTPSGQQLFTMINFARKFATNKDLFSEAEIIIIKLPNLTQFSNTGEESFFLTQPLQQAAGYFK